MSDPYGKITEGKDLVGKIRNWLAGWMGYVERDNRREADRVLRETIAQRYEEQWERISALQRELIADGKLDLVDDLEAANVKLRAFIDRARHASYGYAGFFDAVRVNEAELTKMYEYDSALLEDVQKITAAIDNLNASLGTDGLPAAIRNLVTLSQDAVDAFNRREEIILATQA